MTVELSPWVIGPFLIVFGLMIGSFLNVVIARLPAGESVVRPRSRCPGCGHLIRWYDNVPVLSYLWLRRKCRDCAQPISARYPLVELLTAAMLVLLWTRFGSSKELLVHFSFTAALIAISFIDLDHRIIPNEISLPGIVIAFAASFLWPGFWVDSLLGILLGAGGLFLLSLVYSVLRGREGMGMGDVKMLGMLGGWLGWQCLPFVLLLASIQGVIASLVLWLAGVRLRPIEPEEEEAEEEGATEQSAAQADEPATAKQGESAAPDTPTEGEAAPSSWMSSAIPFGPFLALSAIEYVFFAERLIKWLTGQ